ncbi:two-component sensor histidine kinase [Vibrio albus]|uniref:histidine kinase n=1 Tax=Vibrio albus TaxID=2200953 RepID=A0A2U3B6Z7_9VIBR|nr:HAMP domain-containing sensor histidine kinase [Vibrio albus]PWI32494.1 two-component sensor histidine kinase [Vibrio albus]
MSYVDEYALSRSSVFKTLLGLFLIIGVLYAFIVQQVFVNSESFHQSRLARQLLEEKHEIDSIAEYGPQAVDQLLNKKKALNAPFSYRFISLSMDQSSHLYPAYPGGYRGSHLKLKDGRQLEIRIRPELLEAYRKSVLPVMMMGVFLPVALMFAAAAVFAIVILRKLQHVNQAMNRVLCGEKQVKLPVSTADDEFDILAIHLNFMIEQMEKNEASMKSLTVGIAHDMRTPMARLKLRIEQLLDNRKHDPKIMEELCACHDDLELTLSLFNNMLDIARINSGQQSLNSSHICLSELSEEVVEFLRPLAEQKHQTLYFRTDETCTLNGDRTLLFRAIFNLAENAIKYTPEQGSIEVIVDSLGVVIADSGKGITDKDKSRVCEPMFRADHSRSEPGCGLGLSLVEAIAHRHNMKILFKDNIPGLRARLYMVF